MKRLYAILSILLVLRVGLSACAKKPTPTPTPLPPTAAPTQPAKVTKLTATPAPTKTPKPTETPEATLFPLLSLLGGAPRGNLTISIWHDWQGQQLSNINSILDEYQRTCPDIHLELLGKTDLADVAAETLLAADGPDIFIQTNSNIGRLADSQAIIPLDAYIDQEAYTQNYSGVAVSGASYKGKIYGYPESTEVITMIYNQDLISADELPTNTDDLLARAAAWDKTDYYFVYNAKNDAYFSIPWWQAAGVTIIDDEGNTTFASNAGYTAGNFIYALHKIMPDKIGYNIADTMFKEGRAPIIVNGPWYIEELDEAGINYGLHVLPVFSPTGVPAMPFVDVRCLLMTPNADDRGVAKAAVNLMQYYTRVAAQIELAQVNKMVPANNGAAADPAVKALPVVATFGEQAALGKPMPSTPFINVMWDPIARGLECIWTDQGNVKTCVDRIQALAEANIEGMK